MFVPLSPAADDRCFAKFLRLTDYLGQNILSTLGYMLLLLVAEAFISYFFLPCNETRRSPGKVYHVNEMNKQTAVSRQIDIQNKKLSSGSLRTRKADIAVSVSGSYLHRFECFLNDP